MAGEKLSPPSWPELPQKCCDVDRKENTGASHAVAKVVAGKVPAEAVCSC